MADLEHGTWAGNSSLNAQNNPITTEFVTAMLKGKPNHMALMGADAQSDGPLQTMYDGPRPKVRARASQTIQLRPDLISKLQIRSFYQDRLYPIRLYPILLLNASKRCQFNPRRGIRP